MFDLDAGKILVVGVVALLVIGPKDLPRVLRTVGQTVGRMRRMASEFQNQFMEAIKEADLEEVKKEISAIQASAVIDTSFDAASIMRDEITSAVEGPRDVREIGHSTIDLTGTGPTGQEEPAGPVDAAPQPLLSLAAGDSGEAASPAGAAEAGPAGPGPMTGTAEFASAPPLLSLAAGVALGAPEDAEARTADLDGDAPMATAPPQAPPIGGDEAPGAAGAALRDRLAPAEGEAAQHGGPARHGGAE
jgi:sec-independent protein translocase protein TatB